MAPLFPPLVEAYDFEDTGRGCRCVRAVTEGEELLAIPLEDCWTSVDARKAPQLASVVEGSPELSDLNVTALHLLVERKKGADSTKYAHLQQLPTSYDSTLFWSADELGELEGSQWKQMAERFGEEAAQDWAALKAAVERAAEPEAKQLLSGVATDDYLWAYATIKSRTAEVLVDGEKANLLAPNFDLFNHSDAVRPGSSHFFDQQRKALVVVATCAYAEGAQAFISYGTASNGSLLLAGGFVLPSNRFDYVGVNLTAQCDAKRLPVYMMAAPEVGPSHEVAPFEFLTLPEDEQVGGGAVTPIVTRHLLTTETPLPASLLAYVRLERMSDDEMDAAMRKLDKQGRALWEGLVATEKPLDAMNELLALSALRGVLGAMLDAYPTTLDADRAALARSLAPEAEAANPLANPLASRDNIDGSSGAAADAAETTARRRLCALALRAAEKEICAATVAELERRLHKQLASLVGGAAAQAAACGEAGTTWAAQLARKLAVLQQQAPRVTLNLERLQSSSFGAPLVAAALLVQSAAALLLLVGGLGAHPLAPTAAYVAAAWPTKGMAAAAASTTEAGGTEASPLRLPPLSPQMLATTPAEGAAEGAAEELSLLKVFVSKMDLWGSYLLAQWGTAKALGVSDCNAMQAETISIRTATAWSVPTHEALDALAALSPLVEIGAGNGHWASLLRRRGADIVAFDTPRWDEAFAAAGAASGGDELMGEREAGVTQEGGPEQAAAHANRTLVLMWPDYHGHGSYGLSCLTQYTGERLALVGEWRGRTFGAYTQGIPETGQSFSAEMQAAVEEAFELERTVRLPNWPCYLDTLMVWRRKKA